MNTKFMNSKPPKYWYVLYTKPRHEFKAEAQINSLNIESYLPTNTVIKQWSDRKKKITEPLFKSYIFRKFKRTRRQVNLFSGFFFGGDSSENELNSVQLAIAW